MSFEPVEVLRRKSTGRRADWERLYGSTEEAKASIIERVSRGQPFSRACSEAKIPYQTVLRWRKEDPGFGQEVRDLMDRNESSDSTDLGVLPPELVIGTPESFLFYYKLSHDRVLACQFSEVRATQILTWSDESSDEYLKDFALEIRDIELLSLYQIEDNLLNKAASGVDFKAMQYVLERRLKERYSRPGQVGGIQVENIGIWFSPQLEAKAVKFLNQMRGESEMKVVSEHD